MILLCSSLYLHLYFSSRILKIMYNYNLLTILDTMISHNHAGNSHTFLTICTMTIYNPLTHSPFIHPSLTPLALSHDPPTTSPGFTSIARRSHPKLWNLDFVARYYRYSVAGLFDIVRQRRPMDYNLRFRVFPPG